MKDNIGFIPKTTRPDMSPVIEVTDGGGWTLGTIIGSFFIPASMQRPMESRQMYLIACKLDELND